MPRGTSSARSRTRAALWHLQYDPVDDGSGDLGVSFATFAVELRNYALCMDTSIFPDWS